MEKAIDRCCLLILLAAASLSATKLEIQTKLGAVTGTVATVNSVQVNIFRGIPYAKPPVGDLRLTKPQPYGQFTNGRLDATDFGDICAQISRGEQVGSEDCLFLNIYAPDSPVNKSVMVWIHGGSFQGGWSDKFPGTTLAATEDVIVVTINYRVNVFGFLTTADSRIPGNYGLWDQRLAIQWIKDNIGDYGGDSSSITIFGESAGGRSVGFQLMTPQNNRDLFQRGITESGSSLSLTYINRSPMEITKIVADTIHCDAEHSKFLECVRSKGTSELLRATSKVTRPFPFFPVVDNDFLTYDLGVALANFTAHGTFSETITKLANFANFDLFSGWNNQEGLMYTGRLLAASEQLTGQDLSQGVSREVLTAALDKYPFHNYPQNSELKKLVFDFYINYYMSTPNVLASENRSIEDRRVEVYSDIASDVVLKLPTIQHLQIHSAANTNAQAYAYEFSHKKSSGNSWYQGPDWLKYGADHTDEIPFVFGWVLSDGLNHTDEEKQLCRDLMRMWASFAKSGNPGAEFDQFQYPREQYYTVLNTGGFEKEKYPLNDVQRIWSAMDASLLKLDHPDVTRAAETEREDEYLSGMVELSPVDANKLITALLVVTVLLAVGVILSLIYAVVSHIKYRRVMKYSDSTDSEMK